MDFDEDYGPEPNDNEITLNAEVRVEWNNEAIIKGVIKQVSERIYDDIKPQVSEAVTSSLHELANKAMSATFDTEIQPTDRWGDPTGDAISIKAMLQRDTEAWLMDSVDSSGRKGRGSYGDRHPRIHWLFEEALHGEKNRRGKTSLQKMVLKAVKETIGDVEALVNEEVRSQVIAALK